MSMYINNSWFNINSIQKEKSSNSDKVSKKNDSEDFKLLVAAGNSTNTKEVVSSLSNRVDKIEFSHQIKTATSSFELSSLKNKIVNDMRKDTDPQKIEDLSKKLSSGSYEINPSEIAKIIFKI